MLSSFPQITHNGREFQSTSRIYDIERYSHLVHSRFLLSSIVIFYYSLISLNVRSLIHFFPNYEHLRVLNHLHFFDNILNFLCLIQIICPYGVLVLV